MYQDTSGEELKKGTIFTETERGGKFAAVHTNDCKWG